jgi:signal peptidase II
MAQATQLSTMTLKPTERMLLVGVVVFVLDQLTKFIVLRFMGYAQERVIIDGFFKFVHWGNTGAAWSLFKGHNDKLAIVSAVALVILFLSRTHFDTGRRLGQIALGLLFGGIMGNLTDRLLQTRQHVIDFIYFYVTRRNGTELGFPAFNLADSAICIGVGLLFILSWQAEPARHATEQSSVGASPTH